MVLVLVEGGVGGLVRDLWRFTQQFLLLFFFFFSEGTPRQCSLQYERMFHTGTLPGNKKDSCL